MSTVQFCPIIILLATRSDNQSLSRTSRKVTKKSEKNLRLIFGFFVKNGVKKIVIFSPLPS